MTVLRLSQVDLRVERLDESVETYDRLFDHPADLRGSRSDGGFASYQFDDFTFNLLASPSDVPDSRHQGLVGLGFATDDIETLRRRFRRLSLQPSDVRECQSEDGGSAGRRRWLELTLPAEATNGLPIVFQTVLDAGPAERPASDASVRDLDLVVVSTSEPEHATAFYGGRLGLDMVLDRRSEGGGQLMQFMAQGRMLEVAHNRQTPEVGAPDRLWGISWKVGDADAARERLSSAGYNVSPVKTGAKPGTRVFTVRDGTCGVPTLVMQQI